MSRRGSRTTARALVAMAAGACVVGVGFSIPSTAAGASPMVIGTVIQQAPAAASPVVAVHLLKVLDDAKTASAEAVERAEARSAAAARRAAEAPAVQSEWDAVGDAALRACTAQTGMTRSECIADAAAGNAS
ncbi:hypothetical protein [Pseudonocardia oroxyli]|nr:hypothetical protein [Pseudonocardia oroxyli]